MARSQSRRSTSRRTQPVIRRNGPPIFIVALLLAIALVTFLYLLSRIPPQAWLFLAVAVSVAILLLVGQRLLAYRAMQLRAEHERLQLQQTQAHEERMRILQMEEERRKRAQIGNIADLLALTPADFEMFVGDLLAWRGYKDIQIVGRSGDLCVDLLARDDRGNLVAVQCKKYAPGRPIGSREVQTFLGMSVIHHKAQRGLYITTTRFTRDAYHLADQHKETLQLVDGNLLRVWVQSSHFAEHAQHDPSPPDEGYLEQAEG